MKAFTFIVLVECLLHVSQWVLCGAGMLVDASPNGFSPLDVQ